MTEFDRTPPHDLDAEQATLGGMLMSRDAIADVAEIITARDHYRPAHQAVHEVILSLYEAGEPTDAVTVANELTKRGEIARVGGAPYLHTLIASVPTAANAGYYARIVRERAILRRLIEAGTRIVQLGYSGDGDADEIAERARREVDDAAPDVGGDAVPSMRDLVLDVIDDVQKGGARGLPLPWRDINDVLCGLAPGTLTYIAARPSIGKSLLGGELAAYIAFKLGLPVLLVSMEMRAEEITLRLISAAAKVPLWDLLHREVSEEDWRRIADVSDMMSQSPLAIDYRPRCTIANIRSRLREMARSNPAAVLIVDYIGLLETPDRAESRNQAVAAISRDLKQIAGEFLIPVVALAQLNRSSEQRPDKWPALSDLRDSGAQEQDADVVLLLHREDFYNRESPRAGEMDIIVAKNRSGPTATVVVAFQGHYARIRDMARITEPAENWSPSAMAAS